MQVNINGVGEFFINKTLIISQIYLKSQSKIDLHEIFIKMIRIHLSLLLSHALTSLMLNLKSLFVFIKQFLYYMTIHMAFTVEPRRGN